MPYLTPILRIYHDDYFMQFKHKKQSNKDLLNHRLKFYWAKWTQKRNTNFMHDFKNHAKKPINIKAIKDEINELANQGLYSVNSPYVKSLYNQLREYKSEEPIKDIDYSERFINGSDVPIDGYYE